MRPHHASGGIIAVNYAVAILGLTMVPHVRGEILFTLISTVKMLHSVNRTKTNHLEHSCVIISFLPRRTSAFVGQVNWRWCLI